MSATAFTIRRFPLAALAALATVAAIAPAAPLSAQIVRGHVMDLATRTSVAGAQVTLTDTSGTVLRRALTGPDGRFVLQHVPRGPLTLDVQALGYAAAADRRILYDGQPVFLELGLQPAPLGTPGLTVRVTQQKPHLRMAGFYDRMRIGHGQFVTPEEIAKRTATRPSELLRRLASIKVMYGKEPIVYRNQRNNPLDCVPNLYVDGVAVRLAPRLASLTDMDAFDNVMPPAEHIEAIEVYPGGASQPAQWRSSNSMCGAIVVWTKH